MKTIQLLPLQNECGKEHPMFLVFRKEKVYHVIDEECRDGSGSVWLSDGGDYSEATDEEARQLESLDGDGEDTQIDGIGFTKVPFITINTFVTACLTKQAADQFIDRHRDGEEMFVEVMALKPDDEMYQVREFLMQIGTGTAALEDAFERVRKSGS